MFGIFKIVGKQINHRKVSQKLFVYLQKTVYGKRRSTGIFVNKTQELIVICLIPKLFDLDFESRFDEFRLELLSQ